MLSVTGSCALHLVSSEYCQRDNDHVQRGSFERHRNGIYMHLCIPLLNVTVYVAQEDAIVLD